MDIFMTSLSFNKFVLLLWRMILLLFAFVFLLLLLRYYVPPRRKGNVVLGRTVGLILSVICARFYTIIYNNVFQPSNPDYLLIFFIVTVILNCVVVGSIFTLQNR